MSEINESTRVPLGLVGKLAMTVGAALLAMTGAYIALSDRLTHVEGFKDRIENLENNVVWERK